MPSNAPETLAEGEFNRFYIRGLCRRAVEENVAQLVIYRAKTVTHARPESERRIGATVSPGALLADLRQNVGVDTVLGVPAGPEFGALRDIFLIDETCRLARLRVRLLASRCS